MEDLWGVNQTLGGEDEGKEADDPFKRLPDELMTSQIFDKISDAKSLCRCSLVSKKFSSLVYQTKTVSFKIPLDIPHTQPDRPPRLAAFPGKLLHAATFPLVLVQQMSCSSIPPHCAYDFDLVNYLPIFLHKFTLLKSLIVEFDYSASGDNLKFTKGKDPVVKWMFDSTTNSFIVLMAPRSIDDGPKKYVYVKEVDLHQIVFDIHLGISVCICILMSNLVPSLPESVVEFVITDSKNQGKMDVGENDLVEIRSCRGKPMFNTPLDESIYLCKLWEESTLEQLQRLEDLASASSAMRVATIFLGKGKGKGKGKGNEKKSDYYDDDYSSVKEAFQGVEAIYIDAVMEMLKEIRGSF